MFNIFSVDVEDYFHPSELAGGVNGWDSFSSRIQIGTEFLLEALAGHQVRGTFFILGWVASRHPKLVRTIAEAGHEIGCHSYHHHLVYNLTPSQFERDTLAAVRAIEDAAGISPRVYRAPSYSITQRSLWALETLVCCGFTHDSSIYPIVHDRYGIPGFVRRAGIITTPSGKIVEVPVATVRLGRNHVAPVGGGAYMRLFPYCYTAAGIRRVNLQEAQPACMYFHPWEMDPGQPRLSASRISSIRTYGGLNTMRRKMKRLLSDFQFATMTSVHPLTAPLPDISIDFADTLTVPSLFDSSSLEDSPSAACTS
jgi:polysaccharide deacetylase family protein (PEP-CTERM system associated)